VDAATGDAVRQNSIHDSGNLGLELVNGGNNGQASPVLTGDLIAGGVVTIFGTLTAAPNATFTLEFFADSVCNPSGYGEGEVFLGSLTVTTDASGSATFAFPAGALSPGQFVAATATGANGDTSAFSLCWPI
jgi:hypothetical protein